MSEKSNYNLFEIEWFSEFLGAFTTSDVLHPTVAQIEAYRGKLPDYLLQFWMDHGWCSWSNGQYWLCDPALAKPVIDYVFMGDPDLDPEKMFAFGYTAFGEIDIWYGDATIRLNLLMDKVRVEPRYFNEEHQRFQTDKMMIGSSVAGRVSPAIAPWEDPNYNNMMPQALERLGRLQWGEIYGFVPALSMGGQNSVDNLQKVRMVEHLVFLASLEPPTLYDYIPPADGEGGFGTVIPGRKIGSQE
ncbi:GAD-like domain-containing protein [Rhizobium halophytocola]|uniref:DUF1851 domain-containing protein n=1 Tax=Rhizobium halophytocola TaxID=735519 RepID=A0ABS4E6N2_9HYPH|nr:GAD-like domain-containing protein [Rhizobium halophytocola]MBP1853599.1 hypothetical protein [Rhizobium halophytocola]